MRILIYDSGIGLIPFYHLLAKEKKKNEYFIEMEEKLFPLGDKDEASLLTYVKQKLEEWKNKYDQIYIICNTFSSILEKYHLLDGEQNIHTILAYNYRLAKEENALVIGTKLTASYLKTKGIKAYDFSFLVPLIEEENIKEIIKELKKYDFNNQTIILGCTHFSHIAFLLKSLFPTSKFIDTYPLLAKEIISNEVFSVNANTKGQKYLKKFGFSHIFIT